MIPDSSIHELLNATQKIVADAFMNPHPYSDVYVMYDGGQGIDSSTESKFKLGSVVDNGDSATVVLDYDRVGAFYEECQLQPEEEGAAAAYIASAMLAGSLLQRNFITDPRSYAPELTEEFRQYQEDYATLLFAVQSLRPTDDVVAHESIDSALSNIDNADISGDINPRMVETVNTQRAGARIALFAAHVARLPEIEEVSVAMTRSLAGDLSRAGENAAFWLNQHLGELSRTQATASFDSELDRFGLGF